MSSVCLVVERLERISHGVIGSGSDPTGSETQPTGGLQSEPMSRSGEAIEGI